MAKLPVMELKETEIKERPRLNANFIPGKEGEVRSMNLDTLIYWVKRTPECIGIIKRIATDIVTEASFKSVASQQTGRPSSTLHKKKEDNAGLFFRRNHGKQKLLSAVLDWLMTGDAYLWMGMISPSDLKELADKAIELNPILSNVVNIGNIEVKDFFDEDWNGVNALEVIPSSMTRIDHNDFKIVRYIQKSKANPGKNIYFSTEEVIHAKFMEIDGKVYGFSPMESDYMAIKTVNAIQDYGYNYFANAAKPDRAWLFSGNPSQTYLDKFEEQLASYKLMANSHRDIVVAGADQIKTERLNEISEEMEYRQLAIHSVGRIAFSFNMPANILSSILGKDIKSGGVGSDVEDAGYNRNIIEAQKYWEDLLNTQLWIPKFQVEMCFEKTFRQDKIRMVQYMTQASTAAEFFMQHEWPVTDEFYHDLLQVPRKYLKEGKIKKQVDMGMPFKPNQLPNKPKNASLSGQKKAEQTAQANNQTMTGS